MFYVPLSFLLVTLHGTCIRSLDYHVDGPISTAFYIRGDATVFQGVEDGALFGYNM